MKASKAPWNVPLGGPSRSASGSRACAPGAAAGNGAPIQLLADASPRSVPKAARCAMARALAAASSDEAASTAASALMSTSARIGPAAASCWRKRSPSAVDEAAGKPPAGTTAAAMPARWSSSRRRFCRACSSSDRAWNWVRLPAASMISAFSRSRWSAIRAVSAAATTTAASTTAILGFKLGMAMASEYGTQRPKRAAVAPQHTPVCALQHLMLRPVEAA